MKANKENHQNQEVKYTLWFEGEEEMRLTWNTITEGEVSA